MKLLAVSGSLRAGSSNHRLLEAVRLSAPEDVDITRPFPIASLPYFNPDMEERGMPGSARAWRHAVGGCDALLISSPEYAHGVPGVLKNALDWLVGGMEMDRKPFALLNATPPSDYARAALRETLGVMGGLFVEEASFEAPLRGDRRAAEEIAADAVIGLRIRGMFPSLAAVVGTAPD